MMLDREQISRAVSLHGRAYQLLQWMAEAVTKGFIRFDTAHDYGTFQGAAEKWIVRHYNDIPARVRPHRSELSEFCALFSTYLKNSFDLVPNPGKQLYSTEAHCFCPFCSWLVDAPNLKTTKPTSADKRRARKMKIAAVCTILAEHDRALADDRVEAIVDDSELREVVSIVAYAYDLIQRTKGIAVGPAALVLWRGFAWKREGSPKKNFVLTVDAILEGERCLQKAVLKDAV